MPGRIRKGKRLLDSSAPLTLCEAFVQYCGKDLSEAPEGTIICKGCADPRQLCQRYGRPLRLADFKGIFVGIVGARLHRGAEKQIIALLLGRQK